MEAPGRPGLIKPRMGVDMIARRVMILHMIRSFRCKHTQHVFQRKHTRVFAEIKRMALKKLLMLEAAERIDDLRVPPGNRLEKLSGDREGQWSIRINNQWRACFRWIDGAAEDVEIVDYH